MALRLGVRSRILVLTMPVVVLVSAAIAGVVYLSLGQLLDASARDLAVAEVTELRSDVGIHPLDSLLAAHPLALGDRVAQVIDARTGRVILTTDTSVSAPIADFQVEPGGIREMVLNDLPGLPRGGYAVAVADATGADGAAYVVLVAVATRVEASVLAKSAEFALIAALGLAAVLGALTTFAVSQALRPVERMRHQVEAVAASHPGPAIDVPPGRDELAKLGETMNRVLERLRRADADRRAFVADAGHELRSPLATIRVLLDRLGENRTDTDRARIAVSASQEVDRLSVLVDDLLALASADEGAMRLRVDDVDLDDVVLSQVAVVRLRNIPVAVAVHPVRLQGDEGRLGRVVRNLLDNAERHTNGRIRVTLDVKRDHAILTVDNDGPLIEVGERERVFQRFVRLDDSRTRDTGGTGLGLAIVGDIVGAHGGTVTAGESPDGWCRFVVDLPLLRRSG
ncbi:MAG: HAMP domain-containing sensor histidine kinase [Ornithinibacter sp.]